jgi:superfamily I DNA and RNA helicase
LKAEALDLSIDDAVVFCKFPLFREEESLLVSKLVLVSQNHGAILISTPDNPADLRAEATRVEGTFNQVFARLVRYPKLRNGRAQLAFSLDAFVWTPEKPVDPNLQGSELIVGFAELKKKLGSLATPKPIAPEVFEELISVIDGSKALLRPSERDTTNIKPTTKAAQIVTLEEEIRRFDRDQRLAYMTEVTGPQRVRGLAGSGKTVVLAMKAAITAIRNPTATIAFTYYTKSLNQHIKQLITRFYRLHEDRDPDWNRLKVFHAWGGGIVEGLYSYASNAFGITPLNYGQASSFDPGKPFAYACNQLLANHSVRPLFDYIFLDEAQDCPPEFMRLALKLVHEENLVIAYDVLQTIFDVEIPTAGTLFGTDERGEPAIAFEEDINLRKCYRNPREIIVCAHAIGFGIYGPKIAQLLESPEHWQDFGYQVHSGELRSGSKVEISRPEENSPSSLSKSNSIDALIQAYAFEDVHHEVAHVVNSIVENIAKEGVGADDILIICADDRNARAYFRSFAKELAARGVGTHNLQEDNFGLRDFQAKGKVTLSTVYKAKGNEAYLVYVVGIDAIFHQPSARSRNIAFTAMTRAKGWLQVSGLGPAAQRFAGEVKAAKNNFPMLRFTYPSPEQLIVMKRDLAPVDVEAIEDALARLALDVSDDEMEALLARKLKDLRSRKKKAKTFS